MRAAAIAHPNVALIKYWGKRAVAGNLPATGSLAIVLGGLSTRTTVEFAAGLPADLVLINGAEDQEATARATACLDLLRARAGTALRARVESRNDFPTAAGLASSASGFAALVTAAAGALGLAPAPGELAAVARLGSGSAARSLAGGFVLLQNAGDTTRCEQLAGPADWPLAVAVAITDPGPKAVGSREGMALSAATSPYYPAWVESHGADLAQAVTAVRERDFPRLAELAEYSCLKMHGLMLGSRPGLVYWAPATVACIHRVRALRAEGVPVFFTIDAGPQVKAVCPAEALPGVVAALAAVPGVVQVLRSPLGEGARLLAHD